MDLYNWLSIIGAGSWLYPISVAINRVLTKPKVRITPGDVIQIGYTSYGPIINLLCAISTEKKDALIERIEAKVNHENGDSHTLTWKILNETQSTHMPFSGEGGGTVSRNDVAIALKVSTTVLSQKNIGFQEDIFLNEAQLVIQSLNEVTNRLKKISPVDYFPELLKSKEFENIINFIKNKMFWKPGEYILELSSFIVTLNEPHIEKFKFNISQLEIDNLNTNISLLEKIVERNQKPNDPENDDSLNDEKWYWINTQINRF